MSLAVTTARSAVWMLMAKIVATIGGIVGTILVINFLDRGRNGALEYGEVTAASIIVATASQITTVGIGQFVVVKATGRRDLACHATTLHVVLGLVAATGVYACREPLARWISAPEMGRFVGGFAIAMMFDRVGLVPERVLMGALRMRTVAITRMVGDLVFLTVSVVLAACEWGGMAIVVGNLARSVTRTAVQCAALDRREWLQPVPLRAGAVREMWRFGAPIWVGNLAGFACRRWDNLFISGFFGAGMMGNYNLAYNLAEYPPVVAEQAIDALFPSFTRLDPQRRLQGFVRALAMLTLITSPLAIGVGVVAPTLVAAFLDPSRSQVAPMLAVLSTMAVTRPLMWAGAAYFQVIDRTRIEMALDIITVVLLGVAIATLGRIDPVWACIAVGLVYVLRAVLIGLFMRAIHGISLAAFFGPQLRPVLACLPMVASVLVVRDLVHLAPVSQLVVEVAAGAAGYLGGAWVIANETFRDALDLAKRAARIRG